MKSIYLLTTIVIFCQCMVFSQIYNPKNIPFTWKTDTIRSSVNTSEVQIVLPKGSFSKLDFPKFDNKLKGLASYFTKEPVLTISVGNEAKAYPLSVLTHYEIINDTIENIPILVSYCPLCNSGIIFNRKIAHKNRDFILLFEVSGMLRNSDMLMLDKSTETLWQQLTSIGIMGELNEVQLTVLPSLVISVKTFFNHYPDGKILSKESIKNISAYLALNPYKEYDMITAKPYSTFFDSNAIDTRLPAMERVVAIENEGQYKAYTFSKIQEKGLLNDIFYLKNIVFFFEKGLVSNLDESNINDSKDIGSVRVFNRDIRGYTLSFKKKKHRIVDIETGSYWNTMGFCYKGLLKNTQLSIIRHGNYFAFAWLAFHPKTEIVK